LLGCWHARHAQALRSENKKKTVKFSYAGMSSNIKWIWVLD